MGFWGTGPRQSAGEGLAFSWLSCQLKGSGWLRWALQISTADLLRTRTWPAGTRLCWASQKSRNLRQRGQHRSRRWSPARGRSQHCPHPTPQQQPCPTTPSPAPAALTDEAEPLLGPGDGHIHLVGVYNEAQEPLQPALSWPLVQVTLWAGTDGAHQHIAPLTPWGPGTQ